MDIKITLNNGTADTVLDDYVLDEGIGEVSRKVESDKPGEPGVVTFDNVSLEFKESDLGSLFTPATLIAIKTAGTEYTVTVEVDFGSGDRTLLVGLVDFDSVEYTEDGTVKFDVLDRLSKIKLAPKSLVRSTDTYAAAGYKFYITNKNQADNVFYVVKYNIATTTFVDISTSEFPDTGDVYNIDGNYYQITKKEVDIYYPALGVPGVIALKITCFNDWIETEEFVWDTVVAWYDKEIYGNDRLNYSGITAISYDAYSILTDILFDVYGSYTADTTLLSGTDFPASLDHFWGMGIGEHEYNLFSKHPQDALKSIIKNMRCYMFWDTDNMLHFADWPTIAPVDFLNLSTSSTTSEIIKWNKKFSWQKRVDMVHVETDYTEASDEANYPDNCSENNAETMNVTVIKPHDSSLAELAENLWEFYGKRHLAASVTLPMYDAMVQAISILTCVRLDSIDYFIVGYKMDLKAETITIDMASYERWEH